MKLRVVINFQVYSFEVADEKVKGRLLKEGDVVTPEYVRDILRINLTFGSKKK